METLSHFPFEISEVYLIYIGVNRDPFLCMRSVNERFSAKSKGTGNWERLAAFPQKPSDVRD
jgi:hypothetical protein